jgi:pimeloyl-ACP methyl ester carboxylesterase
MSILEPLQTGMSLDALVDELRTVLEGEAEVPVVLVGSSWGAMFGSMFAAAHPALVRKLILIGSGPFEESYAAQIRPRRLGRLVPHKRQRAKDVLDSLDSMAADEMELPLTDLFHLFNEADAYDPVTLDIGHIGIYVEQHLVVWEEARQVRASGQLLEMVNEVECPVVAIHGEHDPHPAAGVREPLAARLEDFKFILLKNCGHIPFIEKQAREEFLEILLQEIR